MNHEIRMTNCAIRSRTLSRESLASTSYRGGDSCFILRYADWLTRNGYTIINIRYYEELSCHERALGNTSCLLRARGYEEATNRRSRNGLLWLWACVIMTDRMKIICSPRRGSRYWRFGDISTFVTRIHTVAFPHSQVKGVVITLLYEFYLQNVFRGTNHQPGILFMIPQSSQPTRTRRLHKLNDRLYQRTQPHQSYSTRTIHASTRWKSSLLRPNPSLQHLPKSPTSNNNNHNHNHNQNNRPFFGLLSANNFHSTP